MTLLTKIYQNNRIFLASDERVSHEDGNVKAYERVKKTIILKDCNSAIAVAGFLRYKNEFDILEYFNHTSTLSIPNFDDFTKKILLELPQIPCDDFKKTESIFFLANFKNHIHFKKAIYKKDTDKFILRQPTIPEHYYCKVTEDFIKELKSTYRIYATITNLDYHKLNELVDFSNNYFDNYLATLVTSVFHIHANISYGAGYYNEIKELSENEIRKFILGFYGFINKTCSQGYRQLKSIGDCNQIACVDSQEAKFIFEK